MGVALGWIVAFAFQKLKKESVTAQTSSNSLRNQEGVVLLPIMAGQLGKVRIKQPDGVLDIMATSNEDIKRGEQILVISVKDGIAEVCSIEEFDKIAKRKKLAQQKKKEL